MITKVVAELDITDEAGLKYAVQIVLAAKNRQLRSPLVTHGSDVFKPG